MPEINQYTLSNKELLELIIKRSGFHEGTWMLLANFGISPGNFGPSNDQMTPGVVVGLGKIGIQRSGPNTPKEMTLDAADINPSPKKSKPATSRRSRKD